ncbi:flavin-containing monooxygenase [Prauserella flavalba]|uniref:Monooxygenase n=1 Tax=Prauserella flavalba TaxID=1477506 RepID=A0A318LZ04_9PSEU|nr:NAD(P)/FAD-dependent oxidoreductase [Prauserella flavalba]PXY18725.1 monooxygenase [Prauserella flavalba]
MALPRPPADVDVEELRSAVGAANIPTLVAVLFQLTGDRSWLEKPYAPERGRGMDDNDSGGLPDEVQDEIRAATVDAVRAWAEGRPPAVPAPTGDDLVELLSVCMGEPVPADFEPMMAETLGFRSAAPKRPERAVPEDFSVVVIGAGISGLLAAIRLREAGIRHVVLEKNDDVGGTWYENDYPGAGVDTKSYLYSYSFFPRSWTSHYARQGEVQRYLCDVADHFGVRDAIRFRHEVTDARWDEDGRHWLVGAVDAGGARHEFVANAVITAVGQLNRPKVPDIPGLSSFAGPAFHSAEWPEDLDLTGKRVAVIGSGASAMQIVPAIAGQVSELTVFQRSPQWIAEARDVFRPYTSAQHWLMDNVPFYLDWYRARLAWTFNDKVHPTLRIDPEWEHPERSVNAVNDGHRRAFTRYLDRQLADRPDLRAKALPDYPPFGKRMLLDNGWFAAIKRPNVELVAEGVAEVTEGGVRGDQGTERECDVLVLATGFHAHRMLYPMSVVGRDGRAVTDVWGPDDAAAYLGITVPGFPNLFLTSGPNTILGHGGSHITMAECQVNYIMDLLCQLVDGGIAAAEVREEIYDKFKSAVDAAHSRMIWSHRGMENWYRNAHGRVVSTTPFRVVDYWTATRQADLADYHVDRGERAGTP